MSGRSISPVKIRYTLGHGLNVESFNPRGYIQPLSVLALADFASHFNFLPMVNYQAFLDFDKFTSYFAFIVATSASIGEEMYDFSLDKSQVDIQYTLSKIGTISLTIQYDFFLSNTCNDGSVMTGLVKFIFISPKTRRPYPLPQWWREKYFAHIPQNSSPFTLKRASRQSEEKLDSLTTKVLPNLIDSNLHLGWYFQVKLYMDAYISWHYKNFGFDGKGHAYRNVRFMQLLFYNEASLDDMLKIDLHSVPGNENAIKFYMDKSMKNKAVSECHMEFFPIVSQQKYKNKL